MHTGTPAAAARTHHQQGARPHIAQPFAGTPEGGMAVEVDERGPGHQQRREHRGDRVGGDVAPVVLQPEQADDEHQGRRLQRGRQPRPRRPAGRRARSSRHPRGHAVHGGGIRPGIEEVQRNNVKATGDRPRTPACRTDCSGQRRATASQGVPRPVRQWKPPHETHHAHRRMPGLARGRRRPGLQPPRSAAASPRPRRSTAPTSTCSAATRAAAAATSPSSPTTARCRIRYGGPNYFTLDPNAAYDIHIDNDGDALPT
jgi:hypothetical protein